MRKDAECDSAAGFLGFREASEIAEDKPRHGEATMHEQPLAEPGRQEADAEGTQEGLGCQHHWVMGRPVGPVTKGACRSCGEERDFPSYIEGIWNVSGRRKRSSTASRDS